MRARGTVLTVTGTSTEVGKTVATAGLAAAARSLGLQVAACKPAQTGVGAAESGDSSEIVRLAGPMTTIECYRYPDPLAPEAAARLAGMAAMDPRRVAAAIDDLAVDHDLTLLEGAGGVLVRLAPDTTVLDLATATNSDVVVVVAPGLGTLNHAELAVEAIRARGVRPVGLVVGWWPEQPDLAMRCNREDLPLVTGVPVVGVVPQGAGLLDPVDFQNSAVSWFDPQWLRQTFSTVVQPSSPYQGVSS